MLENFVVQIRGSNRSDKPKTCNVVFLTNGGGTHISSIGGTKQQSWTVQCYGGDQSDDTYRGPYEARILNKSISVHVSKNDQGNITVSNVHGGYTAWSTTPKRVVSSPLLRDTNACKSEAECRSEISSDQKSLKYTISTYIWTAGNGYVSKFNEWWGIRNGVTNENIIFGDVTDTNLKEQIMRIYYYIRHNIASSGESKINDDNNTIDAYIPSASSFILYGLKMSKDECAEKPAAIQTNLNNILSNFTIEQYDTYTPNGAKSTTSGILDGKKYALVYTSDESTAIIITFLVEEYELVIQEFVCSRVNGESVFDDCNAALDELNAIGVSLNKQYIRIRVRLHFECDPKIPMLTSIENDCKNLKGGPFTYSKLGFKWSNNVDDGDMLDVKTLRAVMDKPITST